MAHLWVTTEDKHWAVFPLDGEAFVLTSTAPHAVLPGAAELVSGALLVRKQSPEASEWVLLASAGSTVSLNGLPLATGIRIVYDRDEIRIPGAQSIYFSAESLVRVELFPGFDHPLFCPRCKQEIEVGASAVQCPACRVWHHETEELNCWTYADVCALCAQQTDLNAGFQWTPEDL